MEKRLIEQSDSIDTIIPYIITYQAELNNPNRPIGVFFLLGPTGTGKSHSIEALAEVLHGERTKVLRIDCGQFQQSQEVAKLIGAPPGYLGHRETTGMLTQTKINATISTDSDISLILFDEVEKAHPTIFQTLLAALDKGEMTMGDNSVSSFKKSLIFFTSNLGAAQMQNVLSQGMGFLSGTPMITEGLSKKLESIGTAAAKKKFTPEFFNRLDEVITYRALSRDAIKKIYDIEVSKLRTILYKKTSPKNVFLMMTDEADDFLINTGFSDAYGARELSRVMQRKLIQPLSNLLMDTKIVDDSVIQANVEAEDIKFKILDRDEIRKIMGVTVV